MSRFFAVLALACFLLLGARGTPESPSLESRTVTLREGDIPLSKALAELQRQSGVTVVDDRGEKDSSIALNLDKAPFWQAADAIAAAARARAVPSREGTVRLARLRPGDRVPPTSYDGDFRTRVLTVECKRQLEGDDHRCLLTLELVWTPTLRPLFLDSQARGLRVLDGAGRPIEAGDGGSSLSPVDDRGSFSLDVSFPAPERAQRRLALLEGKVLAVVPSKFLTFRFSHDLAALKDAVADGAVRRLVQEDVVCRVDRVVLGKDRWSVQVGLDYPAGGKTLESFQAASLVAQNELVLVSGDGQRRLKPTANVIDAVSARRARVTYHFTDRPAARLGSPRDWKPQYQAPARIVEVAVRFRFRDVPLP
jgi:hypothetical protein